MFALPVPETSIGQFPLPTPALSTLSAPVEVSAAAAPRVRAADINQVNVKRRKAEVVAPAPEATERGCVECGKARHAAESDCKFLAWSKSNKVEDISRLKLADGTTEQKADALKRVWMTCRDKYVS